MYVYRSLIDDLSLGADPTKFMNVQRNIFFLKKKSIYYRYITHIYS